jgi:hypothetical protein
VTTSVNTRKRCFKCQEEKPLTDFYAHPMMKDGRLNKCKACNRRDVQENYEKRADQYRAYDQKRGYRPGDKYKVIARRAVKHALISGDLVKRDCEIGNDCKGRIEGHHDDYSKPLQVRWLCKKHHAEVHTAEGL